MKTLFIKNFKIIFLFFILLLSFYKSPHIFLNGRFMAEEGSFYFKNTFLYGFFAGFIQILWHTGYFNFWANLSSIISNLFVIEYSPLASVYCAYSVKLYLFIYILYTDSEFLNTNYKKLITCVIVLVSPPMVAEIWLNTLQSLVYFTILSILIFFQKYDQKNLLTRSTPIVLLITSLSSIISCLFTPFYFIKFLKNKSKNNLYNFVSILIGSLFQTFIFIYTKINNLQGVGEHLRYDVSADKLINYIYNVLLKCFFGKELTQKIFYTFFDESNLITLGIVISILLFLCLISLFKIMAKDRVLFYLVIFFIIQSAVAIYAAKVDQVQGRYAAIPGILLIFSVFRLIDNQNKFLRNLSSLLILFSILTGFYEYKHNNVYPQLLMCFNCPNWKNEVNKWKMDEDYQLKIWDYPRKSFTLK